MKDLLNRAIAEFLERDMHLLQVDANERTITHQLACYMKELVGEYDVDCEYNRNDHTIKTLISHGFVDKHVAPDIIVHKRGTEDNHLVVEAKALMARANRGSMPKSFIRM